jgi:tetratricopeptide (TPR) repeat protein
MTHPDSPRRTRLMIRSLALTAVLALGATACSNGDSSAGSSTSSATPDAKKAATALDAGLKAHSEGDLTAATADYKKTLTYDPTNKFAFYNLALIDAAAGNYGLAEEKYRAALKSDGKYEPALFNLAILRTSRDPKEAISLYKRAVAANEKDAAAWLNLGLLLRAAGQVEEGNKDVLRAIALNPKLKDPKSATAGAEKTG